MSLLLWNVLFVCCCCCLCLGSLPGGGVYRRSSCSPVQGEVRWDKGKKRWTEMECDAKKEKCNRGRANPTKDGSDRGRQNGTGQRLWKLFHEWMKKLWNATPSSSSSLWHFALSCCWCNSWKGLGRRYHHCAIPFLWEMWPNSYEAIYGNLLDISHGQQSKLNFVPGGPSGTDRGNDLLLFHSPLRIRF